MDLRGLFAVSCFVLIPAAGPAFTADPWEGPAFSAKPDVLLQAAGALQDPQEAPAHALLDETTVLLDDARRETRTRRVLYRVLTQEGVTNLSSVTVPWQPWFQERPVIRARVITPGGAMHWLDPGTIAESPIPTLSPEIYSDSRLLRAPLPAISPGSVVEQEIVIRGKAPFFEAGVVESVHFGWIKVPVLLTRFSMEFPSTLPMKWTARSVSDLQPVRTENSGRTRLLFERRELPAVETPEPFVPGDQPMRPHVTFSSGRSWAEVAAEYARIVEKQIAAGPVGPGHLQGPVETQDRETIARQALATVTHSVRYTGVEFGSAGIVPGTPGQTLQRGYGDCKDQATLLVALLRQAGLDAQVALLNAGLGEDIEPDLPGLGGFNHAIVHVRGDPPLWIDPTDRFARLSEVPIFDQGRWALIASFSTENLIPVAQDGPDVNRIVSTREIFLSEVGNGRVIETTEWWGSPERRYRHMYEGANPSELHDHLERYVKDQYLASALVSSEHSDPNDLSSPFRLRLEASGTRVATSTESEAGVVIRPAGLADPLSEILEAAVVTPNIAWPSGGGSASRRGAKERRSALKIPEPYVAEWRYRISPPPGFRLRGTPEPRVETYGPTSLSTRIEEAGDGVATVILRFEVGAQSLSPEEVRSLGADLERLRGSEPLILTFESVGESHLTGGRLREALLEFRRLAALHPSEGRHRAQIARCLLAAGLGEAARAEATAAAALEPGSASAHRALGWTLQHDAIGRMFGRGWDRAGALAAYRKAKELDPDDLASRMVLAGLLEHDTDGTRSGSRAFVDEALAEYREARKKFDLSALDDAILEALFRSGRYDEARQFARPLQPSSGRTGYILASLAAADGADKSLAELSRMGINARQRQEALGAATVQLLLARRYPAAAVLAAEAAKGSLGMGRDADLIQMLRRLARHEEAPVDSGGPRGAARRLLIAALNPRSDRKMMADLFNPEVRTSMPGLQALWSMRAVIQALATAMAGDDHPWAIGADLLLAATEFKVEGTDAIGYKVHVEPVSSGMLSGFAIYFVVEGGRCLVQTMTGSPGAMGLQATDLVGKGDLEGARRWLDWAGGDTSLFAGDSLSAIPFSGLWTPGVNAGRNQILYAAASLVAETPEAESALPILSAARALKISDAQKLYLDLAQARAFLSLGRHGDLQKLAGLLVETQPKMGATFSYLEAAYVGLKQWSGLREAARKRLSTDPDDREALHALAEASARLGDLKEAERIMGRMAQSNSAQPDDLNMAAWLALARPPVREEAVRYAERSVQMTGQLDPDSIHTLAALYAESGRLAEALQALLRGMDLEGIDQPGNDQWFVLGQIAEQMGERETALAAYSKVTAVSQGSTFYSCRDLAQRRIRSLSAAPAAPVREPT